DESVQLLSAAPARAVVLVAVLGGHRHGPQVLPPHGLRRAPAHGRAGALLEPRGVPAARARDDRGRPDRGRVEDLVGPAAERALPDARDARDGRLHGHRGRAVPCGARRVAPSDAMAAALRQSALAHVLAASDPREPLARDALQLRSGADRPRPRQGPSVPAAPPGAARARPRRRGRARLRPRGRARADDPRARDERASPDRRAAQGARERRDGGGGVYRGRRSSDRGNPPRRARRQPRAGGRGAGGELTMSARTAVDRRLNVAPMMERTDRHCRYFLRLLAPRTLLYTEMVTAAALKHGDRQRLLAFDPAEHPVALQLGGSEPDELAAAARLGADRGYDEINLNVGCPSDRVQAGCFGAALMLEPERVAACVEAMRAAVDVPVTVKTRLGVDDRDSYEFLSEFVRTLAEAGCETVIVHARKAWLKGLSPKQNR